MSKRVVVAIGVGLIVVLTFIGLGFAAMSINPPYSVSAWVPVMFFVLAGIAAIITLTYLFWPLIIRIRNQASNKFWFRYIGLIVLVMIVTMGLPMYIYNRNLYVEKTRPILSLEPNVKSVTYDAQSYTAKIAVEYTLLNIRDKPSYQTQVRFATFRDIDPSNIETLPDQTITNPIYKTANHQVIETFTFHLHSQPHEGQIINITYSEIRYADAAFEKANYYTETWWYALTMYFDANGQLIKVDNEEIDPSLKVKYKALIESKFPYELGAEQ